MATETLPALAPAEPTTPIRPSEALRLGRLLYPRRIVGTLYSGRNGACAIGAIAAGMGWSESDGYVADGAWQRFLTDVDAKPCPVCGRGDGGNVAHLNDQHHWSDDQIVAWLESLGL